MALGGMRTTAYLLLRYPADYTAFSVVDFYLPFLLLAYLEINLHHQYVRIGRSVLVQLLLVSHIGHRDLECLCHGHGGPTVFIFIVSSLETLLGWALCGYLQWWDSHLAAPNLQGYHITLLRNALLHV